MFAIKFTAGIPYFNGTGIHGHVFATDTISEASQFATRQAAEDRAAKIRNIRGEEVATTIVAVPGWACC